MITLIGNLKGGTGKSTIAFNLAVWSARQQRRTLLVDSDPQHTSFDLAELRRKEKHQPQIYSLAAPEHRLGEALAGVKAQNIFENVIVDIAAGDRESFRAGLEVADRLVVPVLPGLADIWALQSNVMGHIKEFQTKRPKLSVFAVLNRADTNTQVRETQEAEEALRALGLTLAKSQLGNRVTFRRSLTEGLGVAEWEPRSRATEEVAALAKEILA